MALKAWELDNFRRLAENLSALLGPSAEVVIHDLDDLQHSIVCLAGDVTHREPGQPMTTVGLEALRRGTESSSLQGSYRSVLPDGRVLKCSSTFLRNAAGRSAVALCINIDVTQWNQAADLLLDFASVGARDDLQEEYVHSVPDMIASMVNGATYERHLACERHRMALGVYGPDPGSNRQFPTTSRLVSNANALFIVRRQPDVGD